MIRASVQYRHLVPGVSDSTLFPAASIEYVILTVSDVTFRYPRPAELQYNLSYVLDVAEFSIAKVLSDTVGVADALGTAQREDLYDSIDPTQFTDQSVLSLGRSVADAVSMTDQVEVFAAVGRSVSDTLTAADYSQMAMAFRRSDRGTLIDEDFNRTFAAVRSVSDAADTTESLQAQASLPGSDSSGASDELTPLFHKRVSDTVEASDSSLYFDASTVAADSASATDDIDGIATPLDDQEIQVFKQRSELLAASDSVYLFYVAGRTVDEVLEVPDSSVMDYQKPLADGVGSADVFNRVFTAQRAFADANDVTELVNIAFARSRSEAAQATDLTDIVVQKAFADGVSVTDASRLTREQFPADAASATDDLDGVATPLDDQEISLFKVRSDVAGAVDEFHLLLLAGRSIAESINIVQNVNVSVTTTRSDTVGCSDSGVLFMQDYVARTDYFADDYVGTTTAI